MADDARYMVNLECTGLDDPDALIVSRMWGREEISRLYQFDLICSPRSEPIFLDDFQTIIDGDATISFGPDREHPIRGVVREIEILPARDIEGIEYRFRIVPRLADSCLTRGSWIYQELDPAGIITKALTEILPEQARYASGEDFDLQLGGSYTPREYVVQYEESIFDFVSRQAEHWGIFYFFDHMGEKELAIFSDSNNTFPQLSGFEEITCDDRLGAVDLAEHVMDIAAHQRVVPKQISLRDYNYRIPSVALVSDPSTIDETGIGDVHVSHDHFWTPAEGNTLAALRSEQMFGRKLRMTAHSRVRGLRAGHRFTLVGGVPELLGLAREYLVVAVEHHYGREEHSGPVAGPYGNTLTLMPYECAYRPDRITPAPRIYGITHATIDSEAGDDGVHAPVDDFGRYKVVLPWDVAGQTGGKATCWIRVATMSGGGGYGMSQQYHVGDEVGIYHLHGDPDRPVIAGALPNHEQIPVVTSQNANRQVIRTRGGAGITFSD